MEYMRIANPVNMITPLVSVIVPTYQHASFINECLDGILTQQTNFPFEIIVGEDESTDGTREICKEYAEKHPDKIRLFLRSRKDVIYINGSATGRYNLIQNLKTARGKYIALCEGDDYWTDPNKLQKQVDFLEANPEYSLCFHNCTVSNERTSPVTEYPLINNLSKSTFETEDILQQWFIPTASIVYKQEGLVLPEWFQHVESGDIALLLLVSLLGKFKYLDEVMCVYRLHPAGISAQHSEYRKAIAMTYLYQSFNIYTNYKYKEEINEAIKHELHFHVIDNLLYKKETELLKLLKNKTFDKKVIAFIKRQIRKLKYNSGLN